MQYDTLQNLCHRFPVEDLKKQYLRLLSGLSLAPDVPTPDFLNRVQQIGQLGLIYVCYDDLGLVGTATLIYEPKILRGLGIVGHIEDVVVCEQYRGRGITSRLVQHLKQFGWTALLQGHSGMYPGERGVLQAKRISCPWERDGSLFLMTTGPFIRK